MLRTTTTKKFSFADYGSDGGGGADSGSRDPSPSGSEIASVAKCMNFINVQTACDFPNRLPGFCPVLNLISAGFRFLFFFFSNMAPF